MGSGIIPPSDSFRRSFPCRIGVSQPFIASIERSQSNLGSIQVRKIAKCSVHQPNHRTWEVQCHCERRVHGSWRGWPLWPRFPQEGAWHGREVLALKDTLRPLPGGSPFLYQFELDLVNLTEGSITNGVNADDRKSPYRTGGLVTNGLVGVTGQSGTQQPPTTGATPDRVWFVPNGGIVTTNTGNPAPYNQESSVTWSFAEGAAYSQVGEVGLFTVETTGDFPDNMPPVTPGVTIIDFSSNSRTEP